MGRTSGSQNVSPRVGPPSGVRLRLSPLMVTPPTGANQISGGATIGGRDRDDCDGVEGRQTDTESFPQRNDLTVAVAGLGLLDETRRREAGNGSGREWPGDVANASNALVVEDATSEFLALLDRTVVLVAPAVTRTLQKLRALYQPTVRTVVHSLPVVHSVSVDRNSMEMY